MVKHTRKGWLDAITSVEPRQAITLLLAVGGIVAAWQADHHDIKAIDLQTDQVAASSQAMSQRLSLRVDTLRDSVRLMSRRLRRLERARTRLRGAPRESYEPPVSVIEPAPHRGFFGSIGHFLTHPLFGGKG